MAGLRDVWVEKGVVWAAAAAGLPISASRRLTQRAIAMAGETTSNRIMLDFRRATLTSNTLALAWHADVVAKLPMAAGARIAMLCQQPSINQRQWELSLQRRGHQAAAFVDDAAALVWLEGATRSAPIASPPITGAQPADQCTDAESLKQLLQRYADGLGAVPHDQVVAEFLELLDCLLSNAELLGVDAMRGLEQQLRSHRKQRHQRQ